MQEQITFVTGNAQKAQYLEKYLGVPVSHQKIDLLEIQSLSLKEIVEHKVRQAYDVVKKPVIVEDVSLELEHLKGLPGPFIRFFLEQLSLDELASLAGANNRGAIARCVIGYYDGAQLQLFEGSMRGRIAESPRGERGYGWDKLFIPEGYDSTRAELNEEEDRKTYIQIKPFEALKQFILTKQHERKTLV